MVTLCNCTGLQTVKGSDNDNQTSLIQITFISCIEENSLLGWGIRIGILNITYQNFKVVEVRDEERDTYAIPSHNAYASHEGGGTCLSDEIGRASLRQVRRSKDLSE